MIERVQDYPGYLIRFNETPTPRAYLFFHGFPANMGTKGLDIADAVFRQTGETFYILHYRGLGESPGSFLFSESLVEAQQLIPRLITQKGHRKVTIIGHSWGGLAAIHAAIANPKLVEKLILMSPFIHMEKTDPVYQWMIHEVRNELPGVYGGNSVERVRADVDRLEETSIASRVIPQLSKDIPVSLIQSRTDDVTPAATLKRYLHLFPSPPRYTELDLDHSFSEDKRVLFRAIFAELPESGKN